MNYNPTDWKTGAVITAPKLNNIETGLVNAASEINTSTNNLSNLTEVVNSDVLFDANIVGNQINFLNKQNDQVASVTLPDQIKPLVATLCPATTVSFMFSEDGTTFSFTGGTFLWMSSKEEYGITTFSAQINIPYVTGRVIVLNVSNPDNPTVTTRPVNTAISFSDGEYVIGNMFNYNTNPRTQTVTVYGSGTYSWSSIVGHHEAYGSIADTGNILDLVIGDITVRATKTGNTTASISVLATNTDLPNIDIRRFSIYDGTSEGAAFDGVTLSSTTPTVVDDTVYTNSQDSCTLWIGNGRQVTEVKIFISGAGQRCRIVSDYLSQ